MKVTLILPSSKKSNPDLYWWKIPKAHRYPGLGLLTVAALCPPHTEIKLIDDEFEDIHYADETDLVAISTLTVTAQRAYEISRSFRDRKIPVVLGGIHVTDCPDEASNHADSVVIGEAEDTWPELVKDITNGKLKKFYKSSNNCELSNLPFPRRDLLDKNRYIVWNTVQATRGCPFKCEFCAMISLFGSKTRFRPVEEVIEEIKSLDGNSFLLNDDNLGQSRDYFKELFQRLIPLKKKWVGEASWNIAKNEEILDLLEKSGCRGLAIGFESLEPQHGVKKISSLSDNGLLYKEVVEKLHNHQISVMGNFIFGFDNESASIFEDTLGFAIDSKMDAAQFSILIPFPGTALYKRLEKEGRIEERNWNNYSGNNLSFKLKNMPRETFLKRFRWVKSEFNSYRRIAQRVMRGVLRGINPYELGLIAAINLGQKKNIKCSA